MADTAKQPAADEWERMLSGELYVADSPQQHDANMRKTSLGAGHQHIQVRRVQRNVTSCFTNCSVPLEKADS